MTKNRGWFLVFLLAVGLVIGACGGPAIPGDAAGDAVAAQERAAPAANPEATADQVAPVSTLPDEGETASTSIDQTRIDRHALDSYQGMPVGFTEEGYPYLGQPDAPVTLEEYSDFLCPFCQRHFEQTVPSLLEQYVQAGQAKYVFRDMPLVSLHPTAPIGHVAARCAAEQGAAYFWAMHDQLFTRQNEWSQLPDPSDFVAGVAEALGLDTAAYQACMAAGDKEAQVEESVTIGRGLGFNGTPSFQFIQHENDETYTLVGAHPVDTFSQWLDALLAGEAPPQEEEPEPPELPYWANAEGLAPDPDRPGFTLAGDPYKGNPDAALVVVEFADFQCDSCQRYVLETQPTVDEQFVDTGQIMWVFKPLPLKEHPQAPAAAVAAECAADQGQFWDMHHLLFETLDDWSTAEDPDAALLNLAEELNLDMEQFSACLGSREALERVLSDMYDAQGVAQNTPTFIALYGGSGTVFRGSRSVDEFVPILQNLLEQANAGE